MRVMNWITLSLLAAVFYTALIFFIKAITQKGVESAVLNFWFFFLSTIGFAGMALFRGQSLAFPGGTAYLFLGLMLVALRI